MVLAVGRTKVLFMSLSRLPLSLSKFLRPMKYEVFDGTLYYINTDSGLVLLSVTNCVINLTLISSSTGRPVIGISIAE